jgi:hypothetical protein
MSAWAMAGALRLFCWIVLGCVAVTGPARADDQPLPLLRSMSLLADTPNYVDFAAGGYALYGDHQRNQDLGVSAEIRLGQKWNYIGPALGIVGNVDGGFFIYAGGYTDIRWGPVVVTPLLGVGADHHGDARDEYLGGVFEFRLQLTAAYQFADASRLGLMIGHISSAHINKVNPGDNELMVSYGYPFRL